MADSKPSTDILRAALSRLPPSVRDIKFPTPFIQGDYGDGVEPYSRVEQQVMLALGALKEKPSWWTKVHDATIAAKWRAELVPNFVAFLKITGERWVYEGAKADEEDDVASGRVAIAEKWADAVVAELVETSKLVLSVGEGTFAPGPVDGTWMSTNAVKPALKARLEESMKPLENPVDRLTGQPAARDFHPGSDEQVVDIVHPSLYPFVYNKSLIAPVDGSDETILSWKKTIGTGTPQDVLSGPKEVKNSWMATPEFASFRFQWLPSEIEVAAGGDKAEFRSYINNLHPEENGPLYKVLEEVFAEAFVPMFNKVLTELAVSEKKARRQGVDMGEDTLYGPAPEEKEGEDYDAVHEHWYNNRVASVKTDLTPYVSPYAARRTKDTVEPPAPIVDLAGKRLQVIVKLATIELSPSKPKYNGGSWHVEGMENESIIASGIYYWHSSNIRGGEAGEEPTRLAFRTSVRECNYEQNDDKGVEAVYGLFNEKALIQDLASVPTAEGTCLAWPNTLQHQVQPFSLLDATKPGYRKILVFFLVDPTKRILSTSDVPPQQHDWMLKELTGRKRARSDSADDGAMSAALGGCDVLGEVLGFSWHFPHADALKVRDDLMEERKVFTDGAMKEAYERPFSLCEH